MCLTLLILFISKMTNSVNRDRATINVAKLKLLSINVNSIVTNQRRASLTNILKLQNPDVVFLAETKLKKIT